MVWLATPAGPLVLTGRTVHIHMVQYTITQVRRRVRREFLEAATGAASLAVVREVEVDLRFRRVRL